MFTKRITSADLEKAVASAALRAANEAALSAKVDAFGAAFNIHQVQCKQDKDDLRRALGEQDQKRQYMHEQNKAQFDRLNAIILRATGAWGMLTLLGSIAVALWQFFK